jgi:hypothetical protein
MSKETDKQTQNETASGETPCYAYPKIGEQLSKYQPNLEYKREDGQWVKSGVITATMSMNFVGSYRYKVFA